MFGGKTNIFSSGSKECKFLRTTKFYIIGTISTILLITLTVFSFSPIINKTESAKAAAVIADASINITSASDMVNVDITLNEKKSVFAASTADLTFNVLTNSVAGYKLAISSTDPSGELTNTEYGDKIDTITSPTNATTFANDTTTTYDNKWGIKPSKLNSTANTDYLPAPTSPTILDITSLPNTIVPNNYSIGIAARLDSTKSVGAYTDTIILVAITNPISYEFKFLDNTSDSSVTNLPPSESGSSIAIGGFIMPTKAPTRTGYTFKSWCNGTVTHIAGNDSTCSGTTYDKGAPFNDFNDPANPNNKISFYAMWAVDNYSLTLNNDDATTVGSTKARVFYNNNIIYDGDSGTSAITNPTRAYNISGFTTSGNNAAGASVSSAATLSFTYGFDGWYTPGTSPIRIITPSKTLVANTPYTNSAGKWTSTSGAELHAHWLDNGASITLPTITKSGFTCGWTTTPSGATSIEYASGLTGLRPTKDMTLYGVCTPNPYDITIRTATGID
ncbi:MAG: hypothetical protein Q4F58_01820, partial [Candidatus Saccharibacteria bacterium]|nr:hypothetical protein [Candidatus Saccharibacteria bacterium]